MLSEKQTKEIRNHLEKAQNPLFFFDNDNDGLCGFLLLRRAYDRGKGVAVKSFPDLNESYLRKIDELNPDYVFILDKPIVAPEFILGLKERNIPVVWIDHHDVEVERESLDYVYYYNDTDTPVTYICWKVVENKEDMWIAMVGCISDNYLPDFAEEFAKENPDLFKKVDKAFDALYNTDIGKIGRVFNFGLKDSITKVVMMIKFLFKVKSPYDVLKESRENNFLWKRFEFLDGKYQKILEKAKNSVKDNLVFFEYSGDFSMSADLSNELSYLYPGKIVVVAYIMGEKVNVSFRGKNVLKITEKVINGLVGARGGGHRDATGASLSKGDLEEFKSRVEREVL
ncbi:MAG: hypothetical protein KKF56_02835 [Nanoarchaeota archaeon]|nr:hypothetical protein [Nanoarchaeota archaeon]